LVFFQAGEIFSVTHTLCEIIGGEDHSKHHGHEKNGYDDEAGRKKEENDYDAGHL